VREPFEEARRVAGRSLDDAALVRQLLSGSMRTARSSGSMPIEDSLDHALPGLLPRQGRGFLAAYSVNLPDRRTARPWCVR
jgi:hypothetical protein